MKAIFLALLLSASSLVGAQDIVFTRAELQQELQTRMPLVQRTGLFDLTLSDPVVELKALEQRLQIRTAVLVSTTLGGAIRGEVTVDGKLRYKNSNHSFYIDEPKIQDLQVDGMPEDLQAQLKLLAQDLLLHSLTDKPIYRLKDDNVQEALARMMLKSIRIEEDSVLASLSLF